MIYEKPFIHLLRSPNSGYFFDVNRNEIVQVDEEVFEPLYAEQIGEDTDSTVQTKEKRKYLRGKDIFQATR